MIRERTIRAMIERLLLDAEFLQTMRQAPARALRAYGLAHDAAPGGTVVGQAPGALSVAHVQPTEPELTQRVESLLALGQIGAALIDCEIAERQMAGVDYRVYQLRGRVLYQIGDLYGALSDLSRAIELAGGLPAARLWRGLAYHALGDWAAACDDLAVYALCHPAGAGPAISEIAGELRAAPQAELEALAA